MRIEFFDLGDYANRDQAQKSGGIYGEYLEDVAQPSFLKGAGRDALDVALAAINCINGGASVAVYLVSDEGKVLDNATIEHGRIVY